MSNEKENVALTSVVAAVVLTVIKLVVGALTGSLGIISEAAHSSLDLGAALVTYFAVKISGKPADKEHQFGHGKVENFSALFETLLLLVTCVWIVYEALHRLVSGQYVVEVNMWSFLVMIVSILINISRTRALMRVAKKYNSQALEADALHFSSDILSSFVVILGLIFVRLGMPIGDPVAALGVALLVVIATVKLGSKTIDALLDRAPAGAAEEIRKVAQSVSGVVHCSLVRVRPAGSHAFVDMKLCLGRGLTLEEVNAVIEQVEKGVQQLLPGADVMLRPIPALSTDQLYETLVGLGLRSRAIEDVHELNLEPHEDHYHGSFHLKAARGIDKVSAEQIAEEVRGKLSGSIHELTELLIQVELADGTEIRFNKCAASTIAAAGTKG